MTVFDYYKELSVGRTADEEEIKEALNREARIWTNRTNAPDAHHRDEAKRRLEKLDEIEQCLLVPAKREAYDASLKQSSREVATIGEAIVSESSDAKSMIDEVWRLLAIGDIPGALWLATKATERFPTNPWVWAVLGQAKFRWGQTDDAVYEYRRAINLDPRPSEFYFDLGTVYESVEQWQEALDNFERAARIDPDIVMYRSAVGSVLVRMDRYHQAIPILEGCVAEEKDNLTYSWYLAMAYNDMIIDEWIEGPDGRKYCVSKESAERGLDYFSRAIKLEFDNAAMRQTVEKNFVVTQWALAKHWSRDLTSTVKQAALVLFGGAVLSAGAEKAFGSEMASIVFLGIIGVWIWSGFKLGWKINRIALGMQ
ncbi:MAG TPA: tetratricopeptide repeat protein [candidate division Zixibacteria bacterium]|nr:tetratricopeptide repeat protein [candidate division Zixibacteria bacterium]